MRCCLSVPRSISFLKIFSLFYLSLTHLPSPRLLSPSLAHLFPCSMYVIEAARCTERRAAFPILSRALLTLFFSFGSSFSSMWIMRVLLGAILSALSPGHRPSPRAAVLSVRLCFGTFCCLYLYIGELQRYVSLGMAGVSHSRSANPGTQPNNRGSIY